MNFYYYYYCYSCFDTDLFAIYFDYFIFCCLLGFSYCDFYNYLLALIGLCSIFDLLAGDLSFWLILHSLFIIFDSLFITFDSLLITLD